MPVMVAHGGFSWLLIAVQRLGWYHHLRKDRWSGTRRLPLHRIKQGVV